MKFGTMSAGRYTGGPLYRRGRREAFYYTLILKVYTMSLFHVIHYFDFVRDNSASDWWYTVSPHRSWSELGKHKYRPGLTLTREFSFSRTGQKVRTVCLPARSTLILLTYSAQGDMYSRTPLLRPPLGLAICGRNRGVAVIQALEHVAMHMCICGKIHMYNITWQNQVNFYLNYSSFWHTRL